MAIAIKDLVKDLTPKDVLDDLVRIAKALDLPVTAWKPGSFAAAIFDVFSNLISAYWNNVIVQAIRSGFLDYAQGAWLDLRAWTDYSVYRQEATFATGKITLENRGAFVSIPVAAVRVKNAVSGKTYTNQTAGALPTWTGSGPYPTVTLDFVADEAGSASSASIGEIASYPTPLVTGPAGVYALPNTEAIIGDDEERDESLVTRCRAVPGTWSPMGSRAAYEYVARSTRRPDGSLVPINRVRVYDGFGGGLIFVFIATPSGPASGDSSTPGTDVYIVNQALQLQVVPIGITAYVQSADAFTVTFTVTVFVDRGANVTQAEAQADVTTALNAYFSSLPIGGSKTAPGSVGYVYKSEVEAKASEANPGIVKATSSLSGDVTLTGSQVAVPSFTVTAVLVTQ